MTATSIILGVLFILCLTSGVVTRSVGLIKSDDRPSQKIWIPVMFGLSQGIMALAGHGLGRLMAHLFTYVADYMVFAMMLVVAVKLFVDSMRALRGKMLYTVSKEIDMLLLSVLAAFNTFLCERVFCAVRDLVFRRGRCGRLLVVFSYRARRLHPRRHQEGKFR